MTQPCGTCGKPIEVDASIAGVWCPEHAQECNREDGCIPVADTMPGGPEDGIWENSGLGFSHEPSDADMAWLEYQVRMGSRLDLENVPGHLRELLKAIFCDGFTLGRIDKL